MQVKNRGITLTHLYRALCGTGRLPFLPCTSSFSPKDASIGIEFSSPNIAKPFHIGHLRSTFLGRFLSNLFQKCGCKVTRINYLGDYGNQFGVLASQYTNKNFSDIDINDLYENYVRSHKQIEHDPSLGVKVREFRRLLESNDQKAVQTWQKLREIGVNYLRRMYSELNVDFDVWQAESDFAASSKRFVSENLEKQIFSYTPDNLVGLKVLEKHSNSHSQFKEKSVRIIPLFTSDATTLYLTRDVVAAIYRVDEMKLDRIFYVVDDSQASHFENMKMVLDAVGRSDVAEKIEHVKFGKILEMSTRRGKAIFVDDMIRQGVEISTQILSSTPTTKSDRLAFPHIARQMTLTAFLINDFKRKRTTHYSYDWERVLKSNNENSGHLLQACHARLCSLEETFMNAGRKNLLSNLTDDHLSSKLIEPEALGLIDQMTNKSYESFRVSVENLDPSPIVSFLCDLAHSSNAAHRKLKIKDVDDELADVRLLLFSSARMLLAYYLKILGLNPLEKL